ncbi:hypothetical protein VTK73DRAFT_6168 [Phialemonium thermophilum]|uniref:Flp pilus-assembly TadG-like N-terminal domain-containing protein n=1 Tax=Phialemonium thermophilum TaxID=223376 RepID=A0ABR3WKC0_9PEZI
MAVISIILFIVSAAVVVGGGDMDLNDAQAASLALEKAKHVNTTSTPEVIKPLEDSD